MAQKSLMKNALYNLSYTGLNMLFPLISAPYISRVLGASNLGKVNLAISVMNWFLLFAAFGINSYGIREVARNRDHPTELNRLFSELLSINAALTVFVSVIHYSLVFTTPRFQTELPLYLIMSIGIILSMFSLDWLYQGLEEYSYITMRSAFFKVLSLFFMFLMIHQPKDYILYGLISVLAQSISGILNYFYSRRFVRFTRENFQPLRHMRSLSVFFSNAFIINIYLNLDQPLLGFLVNDSAVAFMNRSRLVINVLISAATSITNVAMPRASYYLKNDRSKYDELNLMIPAIILWITIPAAVGCALFAPIIMVILGGGEFSQAAPLLQALTPVIIFSPLTTFMKSHLLLSLGQEKICVRVAILSSAASISANFLLIPYLGYIGAGISATLAEITATASGFLYAKYRLRYQYVQLWNRSTRQFLLAAGTMVLIIFVIRQLVANDLIVFAASVLLGAGTYFSTLFLLKEEVTLFFWEKAKNILGKG